LIKTVHSISVKDHILNVLLYPPFLKVHKHIFFCRYDGLYEIHVQWTTRPVIKTHNTMANQDEHGMQGLIIILKYY